MRLHLQIKRPIRQNRVTKIQENLRLKEEEKRGFLGSLKRPKSSELGEKLFSSEILGTSSLTCMCVMWLGKAIKLHMMYG